jgi:hypothetical protein
MTMDTIMDTIHETTMKPVIPSIKSTVRRLRMVNSYVERVGLVLRDAMVNS